MAFSGTSLLFAGMAPVFDDPEYQGIRHEVEECKPIPSQALFSWTDLCADFAQRSPSIQSLNDRISKWNPAHEETIRFKKCWNAAQKALQDPRTDRLDATVANLGRVIEIVNRDSEQERENVLELLSKAYSSLATPQALENPHSDDDSLAPQRPIFDDPQYLHIRNEQAEHFTKAPLPIDTLFSWETMCAAVPERADFIARLEDQIAKWDPTHTETQKYKECWNRIHKALQDPHTDSLETVVADRYRIESFMNQHSNQEFIARLYPNQERK